MNDSPIPKQVLITSMVAQIPEGRFSTYGRIAALLPETHARQVARVLAQLPAGSTLPWHRVVNSQFKASTFGHCAEQQARLRAEGLLFDQKGRLPKDKVWPEFPSTTDTQPEKFCKKISNSET